MSPGVAGAKFNDDRSDGSNYSVKMKQNELVCRHSVPASPLAVLPRLGSDGWTQSEDYRPRLAADK